MVVPQRLLAWTAVWLRVVSADWPAVRPMRASTAWAELMESRCSNGPAEWIGGQLGGAEGTGVLGVRRSPGRPV
ncbi:MAG: hypothetical protein R2710_02860 [Acidimicrobiales bacterium]